MKLKNQNFRIVPQENIMQHIELCGRTSTMSFDKITDESYKNFSKRLENANHGSVLEHGSVYLQFPNKLSISNAVLSSPYSKLRRGGEKESGDYYLYTNMRVLFENDKDLYEKVKNASISGEVLDAENVKFFTPKPNDPLRRITVELITYKQIETETVRHRVASFTIESTRFINYLKSDVEFIDIRKWLVNKKSQLLYKFVCKVSEFAYKKLIKWGNQRQFAAGVLLYTHKSDMYMTESIEDWLKFFDLRCSNKGAHPAISELSDGIRDYFKSEGFLVVDEEQ